MKKFLVLLLITAMLLLTACSKTDNTHEHSEDSAQTQATHPDDSLMAGEVIGKTYKNDYLGLSFTAPDPWTFFGKDALASFIGADSQLSVKETADTLGAAYAMMAVDHTKEASVTLVYENLNITAGNTLSAQEYIEGVIKQGISQTSDSALQEESDFTIGEQSYIKVIVSVNDLNKPLTKIHYLRAVDNYMVHITASVPTAFLSEFDFDSMFT